MKKIVFFVQWMLCGGVENALISLSKELVKRGNTVTIYVIEKYGEFIAKIPGEVLVKEIPLSPSIRRNLPIGGTKVSIRRALAEHKYMQAIRYLVRHKFNDSEFAELNVDFGKIDVLEEKFDIAVNFHMHSPFLVRYLAEKVQSEVKYAWIHNDFSTTKYQINHLKKYLNCVNHFYGVSEKLVDEFVSIMPEYKDCVSVAHNITLVDNILEKANEFYPKEYQSGVVKILTVGRLEEQKGYDLAVNVATMLKRKGVKFQWFVLGEGTLRRELEDEIERNGVRDCFHLLGIRMNPYPYFKNCDIYVQTSKHEGYVTTITEAKVLCKPIVTTDVSGVREQLVNEVTGEITSFDELEIAERIEKLVTSSSLRKYYSEELSKEKNIEIEDWIDDFK